MRGLTGKLVIAVSLMCTTLYLSAPVLTAWEIREAVKSGDVETLRQRVAWDSVRQTLRQSIAHHAELLPAAMNVGRNVRPTLWQRIKFMFGESMLDRFMDRYITAEGLPQLYQLKNGYRTRVQGLPDESKLPFKTRVTNLLRRLKRFEFMDLGTVELEIESRDRPGQHFVGTLSLIGFDWKLTSLVVKRAPPAAVQSEDEEARQFADDLKNGRLTTKRGKGAGV